VSAVFRNCALDVAASLGGVFRRSGQVSMHQSVVSAFPCKRLITKRVRAVVPQKTGAKGKLENRKHIGPQEAE
jgi:hypothetical protein